MVPSSPKPKLLVCPNTLLKGQGSKWCATVWEDSIFCSLCECVTTLCVQCAYHRSTANAENVICFLSAYFVCLLVFLDILIVCFFFIFSIYWLLQRQEAVRL